MNQAEEIKTEEKRIESMYIKTLEKKAMFLKELLSFVEDKALGFLMSDTEKEENISLNRAGELLK